MSSRPTCIRQGAGEDRRGGGRGRAGLSIAASAPRHLLFTSRRRHLRKGARCRDRLAQPALRHGLPQGRRSATARSARRSGSSETILRFHEAGVRHVILDFVGPYEERDRQIGRFAAEALPLLAALRKTPS